MKCCFDPITSVEALPNVIIGTGENNLTTDKKDAHRYENPCLSVLICG
nr:hypothetical protein [uncultured Pedobacter sp.]